MPNSVERALADALSLEHADVPWSLPPSLPSVSDVRMAVSILTVPPADPKHVSWCLGKLLMAFEPNTRLSGEEMKLRAAVWMEACVDLGNELWSKATLEAIRSSKWMPKPAEFRALVGKDLAENAKKLTRCNAMLAAMGQGAAAKPKAFVPDSRETSLPLLVRSARITGRHAQAVKYATELAELTGEPLPDWATAPLVTVPLKREEREAAVPLTPAQAEMRATLAELGRQHRARQGFGVLQPLVDHVDEPIGCAEVG